MAAKREGTKRRRLLRLSSSPSDDDMYRPQALQHALVRRRPLLSGMLGAAGWTWCLACGLCLAHSYARATTQKPSNTSRGALVFNLRGGGNDSVRECADNSNLADVDKEAFGFYTLLGVPQDASAQEIRTAYRRLAVSAHPDRNLRDTAAATVRFQTLQRVYEVLVDPEQRRLYDETGGRTDDTGSIYGAAFGGLSFAELYGYFRDLHKRVTDEDIVSYETEYRGHEPERVDLRDHYMRFQGDLSKLTAFIPFSEEDDILRFRIFLSHEVDCKNLMNFPAFKRWRIQKTDLHYTNPSSLEPPTRETQCTLNAEGPGGSTSVSHILCQTPVGRQVGRVLIRHLGTTTFMYNSNMSRTEQELRRQILASRAQRAEDAERRLDAMAARLCAGKGRGRRQRGALASGGVTRRAGVQKVAKRLPHGGLERPSRTRGTRRKGKGM